MKRYFKTEERKYLYFMLLKKGYSPEQAKAEVKMILDNANELTKKERQEKAQVKQDKDKCFKEEFKKLTKKQNG